MGSFSWLFADTNNTKNLRANRRGYLACPDGTFICEPSYETYGIFDGKDIYDLVVDWNRKFISENPDHLLPHVHCWTKDGALVRTTYRLKDFPWYPIVADLSIPFEDLHDALIAHLKKELGDRCFLPCFVSVNSPYIALMRCLRRLPICHSTLLTHTSVFCAFAKKQDATKHLFERRTYRCITPVTTARALMWCV